MPGNPHPWRIMCALFALTLLGSWIAGKLLTPLGDAVLNALDAPRSGSASERSPGNP